MRPMETQVPDELEAAVVAAQQGDSAALRIIYESLSPRVSGFLRIRGAEDPDGLTNDVFVKVLPRIAEIVGGYQGVRALAFTVAHGVLVDEFRRRSRRVAEAEYTAKADPRVQPSAEQQALDRDTTGPALAVLELLPADQRAVIVLRVLGELTMAETAAAIGRSERAVKKLQARALTNLRGFLHSDNGRPGGGPQPSEQAP
jgi:RNA polymerase sigma-70 factor (ECF subfamily)